MKAKKILIVEDEGIIALNTKKIITRLGHEVTGIAPSGEKAINIQESNPADLVLMDIKLRGNMDGIQIAKTLYEKYKVPIIFISAYLDEETLERIKGTVHLAYLPKPIEVSILKKELDRLP